MITDHRSQAGSTLDYWRMQADRDYKTATVTGPALVVILGAPVIGTTA